ncbi:MAG: dienelactone hydrolase [Ancylomarina sp.]
MFNLKNKGLEKPHTCSNKQFMFRSIAIVFVCLLLNTSCTTKSEKHSKESFHEKKKDCPELIEFNSLDSLKISAHLYQIDDSSPFILLCHQARFNKFEYAGIAERLNRMGYNCMAIDQRSGGPIGDKQNLTNLRAIKLSKGVDYIDAEPDIKAAILYLHKKYNSEVILWGSSYSSTLALYLAAEMDEVSAVLSFSPGNYMADKKGSLIDILSDFDKPLFLTSSKSEHKGVSKLISKHKLTKNQVQFVPEGNGHHGSRALWINQTDGDEYWIAVASFLKQLK